MPMTNNFADIDHTAKTRFSFFHLISLEKMFLSLKPILSQLLQMDNHYLFISCLFQLLCTCSHSLHFLQIGYKIPSGVVPIYKDRMAQYPLLFW